MNNKIYFNNNGHFDVDSVLTFGVSVKASSNTIGFFGTGFKYAVAIILRLGGSVTVNTIRNGNPEEYVFTKATREVRGVEFDFVQCNGVDAGFTTRMGITWAPWMAYRELRCNASDEGGNVTTEFHQEYETVVTVDCREIAEAHHSADQHFVSGTLIGKWADVEVYDRPAAYVYYQGVAVHQLQNPSKYSYNICKPVELTEDRTAKCEYSIRFAITQCMQLSDNEAFIDRVLDQDKSYEAHVGFDTYWSQSETFINQAIKKQATGEGVSDAVGKMIQSHIDRKGEWPEFTLTDVQKKQYWKAEAFLGEIGINVNDYPVKFVTGLGSGVMGRAHKGTIYLSEIPFNQGTKQVASTLMEEWVHLHTGAKDFDRTMQSWLFDKVLSIGETLNGEPL